MWLREIRKEHPAILFSTKVNTDVYKKELVQLLKQMTGNQNIHFSLIGFPNTGKSSFINAFKRDHLSKPANIKELPIDKNIKLKEKFGTLLTQNETGPLMPKSVKSAEDLKHPIETVKSILNVIAQNTLLEKYELPDFNTFEELLENIAKRNNYYIKKNYPDRERAARFLVKDIIEGNLTYFTNLE